MKKIIYSILFLVVAVMTGCKGFGNDPVVVDANQLVGRWTAPSRGSHGGELVFVFTNEACSVDGKSYGKWGYQYDEGDDVHEDDVLADMHKNGWFGYEVSGDKINLHNMGEFGYEGTAINKVTKFSATSMTMNDAGTVYTFTKWNTPLTNK